jgi:hypothetical protein
MDPKLWSRYFEAETPTAVIVNMVFIAKTTMFPHIHHRTGSRHGGFVFEMGTSSRYFDVRTWGRSVLAGACCSWASDSEIDESDLACLSGQSTRQKQALKAKELVHTPVAYSLSNHSTRRVARFEIEKSLDRGHCPPHQPVHIV